jgi:2-hydroxymuconate-semialdehyde hydrolase
MSWSFPENLETARALYTRILSGACEELKQRIVDDRIALMSAPGYREYFSRMFEGPKQRYLDMAVLTADEVTRIAAKVTLVYGKDDVAVPFGTVGLALADAIAHADLVRLARCGHATMIDAPHQLSALARSFFPVSHSSRFTG